MVVSLSLCCTPRRGRRGRPGCVCADSDTWVAQSPGGVCAAEWFPYKKPWYRCRLLDRQRQPALRSCTYRVARPLPGVAPNAQSARTSLVQALQGNVPLRWNSIWKKGSRIGVRQWAWRDSVLAGQQETYSCSMLQWKSCFFCDSQKFLRNVIRIIRPQPSACIIQKRGGSKLTPLKIVWIYLNLYFYLTFRGGMDRFDYVVSLEDDAK